LLIHLNPPTGGSANCPPKLAVRLYSLSSFGGAHRAPFGGPALGGSYGRVKNFKFLKRLMLEMLVRQLADELFNF